MSPRLARWIGGAALSLGAALPAQAHQLSVFASADCETLTVEARFSTGKSPVAGEVRLRDGADALLLVAPLGVGGSLSLPLDGLPTGDGLRIEVETGGHDNYWIMTPEDFARGCPR